MFFHCNGAPDICSPLRTAVDEALEKAGLSSVRNAGRADIDVAADVQVVQERLTQQFGSQRAVEKSRAVASDIVDKVKAFVGKKRGG